MTIIIVTHNSSQYISECLNTIAPYNNKDINIIIVDNASTDITLEIIKTKFPSITLIQNLKNIGFAAAVNQAAYQSKSDYLLILNPDTRLESKYFEKLQKFIEQKPDLSICGFQLISTKGEDLPSCWKTPTLKTLCFEMFLPHKISLKLVTESSNKLSEIDAVSGACMLIRRETFEKLGGFDDRFFMYVEDLDFCLRARKTGYQVFINPDIKVVHHVAKSSWQDMQGFFFNIYTSKFYFLRKHYSTVKVGLAFILIIIGLKLRIVTYFIAGVLLFNTKLLRLSKYHIFVLKKIITRTHFI